MTETGTQAKIGAAVIKSNTLTVQADDNITHKGITGAVAAAGIAPMSIGEINAEVKASRRERDRRADRP